MSTEIIVSYDGTPNDDDALTLGRMLAASGSGLALAYVRHSHEFDPRREEIAQHDAQRRLDQGAVLIDRQDLPRHVVFSAATGEGLAKLARDQAASMIVFGSDYRTTPGHVEPGTSAQSLLEGGEIAIAVAPAGLRTHNGASIRRIAVSDPAQDPAVHDTAAGLAEKLGATLDAGSVEEADLIVVGSQPGAPDGRIALSGATRMQLDSVRSAVLVLPRGRTVTL